MPTYSYACAACGHRFDIYQAFTDDALTECPECGGSLRKQFGNVGVVFKGSGFYRTDARGKSSDTVTSSDGSSSRSSEKSSEKSGSGTGSSETSSSSSSSGSSSTSKAASSAS